MREFAAFDRRGRLLWTSANFSPVETLGLTAWSHCDPESVEVIQKAVGLAILGISSTTVAKATYAGVTYEFVTKWYGCNLEEVGCFAIWRAIPQSISRLTDSERVVAYWVGSGLSRKEIAKLLGVSISTIDTHKIHIREKVGLEADALIKWCVENRELLSPLQTDSDE